MYTTIFVFVLKCFDYCVRTIIIVPISTHITQYSVLDNCTVVALSL